ncbi:MAG: divergent PAP2 family protein [Candidatus Kerfeldbacteria bacterium]|nr:divergent PAP2 family protein [Candidatus Kerfeldbacteria bacterium]
MDQIVLLIVIPIIAIIIAQTLKVIFLSRTQKITWKTLNSYGAMPSGHTAYVSAVVTQIFLMEGISTAFAVALALAVLTIRDAVGFRWHLQQHARTINAIIQEMPRADQKRFSKAEESLGHRFSQVVVGILIGILTPVIIQLLWS